MKSSSMLSEVRDSQIKPPNRRVTGRGDDIVINATGGEQIAETLCSRVTLSPMDRWRLLPTEILMQAVVHEVAKYFPTSVISGRSRDKDPHNTAKKKHSVCQYKKITFQGIRAAKSHLKIFMLSRI